MTRHKVERCVKIMKFFVLAVFLVHSAFEVVRCQNPACLRCMCEAGGCDQMTSRCRMDAGMLICGPYQITEAYWIDCGRPGGGYVQCTTNKACSERCIAAYMYRYAMRCTGGRQPDCKDYAKIHHGGPLGCRNADGDYWATVARCLGWSWP